MMDSGSVFVPPALPSACQWLRRQASMAIKRSLWLFILAVVIFSMTESTVSAASVEKKFPTLTIGLKTYTNVTITDISGNSVFLSHSRGFESIQIESLSPEVQEQ